MFSVFALTLTNVLTVVCGALAILCYAGFSRTYEGLIRHVADEKLPRPIRDKDTPYSTLTSAIILYAGAAAILFVALIVAARLLGWNFSISPVEVFGSMISPIHSVKWVLAGLIVGMSVLYAVHIATEASARQTINMGAYALVFQVYVLVIAVLDWIVYRAEPEPSVIVGGVILLIVGMFVSASQIPMQAALWRSDKGHRRHYVPRRDAHRLFTPSSRAIRFGIASALACGAALYVDGEVGRNYILKGRIEASSLSVFLGYEMLTFLIPATWTFLWLAAKRGLTGDSALVGAARAVWREFWPRRGGYLVASALSAGQFVFSVFALSLPGPRFVPAMILAASPALAILLDRNIQAQHHEKKKEVVLAAIGAIGFILLTIR